MIAPSSSRTAQDPDGVWERVEERTELRRTLHAEQRREVLVDTPRAQLEEGFPFAHTARI